MIYRKYQMPGTILLFVVSVVCFADLIQAGSIFRYTERTGDKVTQFRMEVGQGSPLTIISSEPGKQFRNLCLADGSQLEWGFTSETEWVSVKREENTLRFKAKLDGKTINKIEKIDSSPWFQGLSFSLRRWLASGDDSITFWMVRPDDLDIHKMKAEREEIESVEVGDRKVEAQRVRVKLAGAFSLFWSVTYWFRTSDFLLVRYEGVHGPPGTPGTTITLDDV